MAKDKVTLSSLRKQLSARTGIAENRVGEFLEALFASISEGLNVDKHTKITGLGTFRLQRINPRESVNVQTGERITIEGYNKVNFVPEIILRDRIAGEDEPLIVPNIPTQSTPIDPLQKLGEQAEEIKDILAELNSIGNVETEDTPETDEAVEAVEVVETVETVEAVEEPVQVEEPTPIEEPVQQEEPAPVIEKEPEEEPEEEPEKEPEKEPEREVIIIKEKHPFQPWKVAGITIVIFCLLLICGYFFLRYKIIHLADDLNNSDNIELTEPAPAENSLESVEALETVQTPKQETATATTPLPAWSAENTEYLTTATLTEGSRLSWLSRKYYGAPEFWVYIYLANQKRIINPNKIGVGTRLRIPKLPSELTDTSNPAAMEQAANLHNQILGKE